MKLPGRFEWKVLAAMLLVAGLAVGAATYAVQYVVRRFAEQIGAYRQQAGGSALRAADLFVAYFDARKEEFRRRAAALPIPDDADELAGTADLLRARLLEGERVVDVWEAPPDVLGRAREAPVITVGPAGGRHLELTFGIPLELHQRFVELRKAIGEEAQLDRAYETVTEEGVRQYLVFVGALLLVALAVGLFLARRVTRRVARLSEAARRVGAGDLTVALAPAGRDELDELARAFDRMVGELAQARARLEYLQKVSAWQEVARRLAHEIKNPLTPIQLAVQELHSKYAGGDPAYRRLLETAREILNEEITGLRRLVDNFSAFAKLPAVEPAPVDLAGLVTELVRLAPEWQPYVQVVPAAGPVPVLCDRTLFRRVIANLVENALQASRGAGREPQVELRVEARPARGRAAVLVDDNGPGVPPADRERIFDPYVTRRAGGTGLGLAIVRKIVIDHGGDVAAEQAPGPLGGARLVVEIPLGDRARPG